MTTEARDLAREASGSLVTHAAEAASVVRAEFRARRYNWLQEHYGVLLLDVRGKPVVRGRTVPRGVVVVSVGTLTSCLVHPREVFRPAIIHAAASVIVWHNHPSGDATQSDEDREVATQLNSAGQILGIPVIDHLILTPGTEVSYSLPSIAFEV